MGLRIEIDENARGRIVAQVSAGRPNTTVTLVPNDLAAIGRIIRNAMTVSALDSPAGCRLNEVIAGTVSDPADDLPEDTLKPAEKATLADPTPVDGPSDADGGETDATDDD